MSHFVKSQAEAAQEICGMLTDEQRDKLKEVASRIMVLQSEITEAIKVNGIDKICGEVCRGECCSQKHEQNIFDVNYFIMALVAFSTEVRQEIMETAECLNLSPRCMYLGEEGCRIGDDSRPFLCKIWFCGSDRKMIDIQNEFNGRFLDLIKEFEEVINGSIVYDSLHNISCTN